MQNHMIQTQEVPTLQPSEIIKDPKSSTTLLNQSTLPRVSADENNLQSRFDEALEEEWLSPKLVIKQAVKRLRDMMDNAQKPNALWEMVDADDYKIRAAEIILKMAWGKYTKDTKIIMNNIVFPKANSLY